MKILIFGSSGMIGTAFDIVCKEKGVEFVGLNHSDVDVTNCEDVKKAIDEHNPTVVINAVVIIGVHCEDDPLEAFKVNALCVYEMSKICEEKGIVFVQPSSHAVFDGTYDGYYTEKNDPKPMNIYSGTKYLSELYALNLCSQSYVVRFSTMFGPRRNSRLGFVDKMLVRIKNGADLKVVEDKIDSMTFSIDVVRQILLMLSENREFGVYHIANKGKSSYYEFVKKLVELLGVSNKVEPVKASFFSSDGHQSLKTAMSSDKLKDLRSWEDALEDYVSTFLQE